MRICAKGETKRRSREKLLKKIYGRLTRRSTVSMTTALLELGENLRRGVPIATPVFDGAREKDIVDMLIQAGQDPSGQSRRSTTGAPATSSTAR